eukprot:TRINITY_DN57147_c0_g1_i2.p1 TRINITY_DN57147_c0_g1~~TRINITY_DN57147_c0_g1_i2.p1  ORF type:complete len:336 (+),score=24.76 TRINITY_DN57147_c0_g1_i2:148-1155(+)
MASKTEYATLHTHLTQEEYEEQYQSYSEHQFVHLAVDVAAELVDWLRVWFSRRAHYCRNRDKIQQLFMVKPGTIIALKDKEVYRVGLSPYDCRKLGDTDDTDTIWCTCFQCENRWDDVVLTVLLYPGTEHPAVHNCTVREPAPTQRVLGRASRLWIDVKIEVAGKTRWVTGVADTGSPKTYFTKETWACLGWKPEAYKGKPTDVSRSLAYPSQKRNVQGGGTELEVEQGSEHYWNVNVFGMDLIVNSQEYSLLGLHHLAEDSKALERIREGTTLDWAMQEFCNLPDPIPHMTKLEYYKFLYYADGLLPSCSDNTCLREALVTLKANKVECKDTEL